MVDAPHRRFSAIPNVVVSVAVWFYGNFKFGFLLESNSTAFMNLSDFLYLIWIILLLGTLVPFTVSFCARVALGIDLRSNLQTWSVRGGQEEKNSTANSSKTLVTLCHLLGMSFTCYAFILGSVSSVQVSFVPLVPICMA